MTAALPVQTTSVRSSRRERTRERLLDAAFEVFAEHGIAGGSIEAVCEAAGFTRGAFYSNFASKEELFHAIVDREARRHLDALERAAAEIDTSAVATAEGFREAVTELVAAVGLDEAGHRAWTLMNAEFELLALREPEVATRYVAEQQRLRAEVMRAIEALLERFGLTFAVDTATAVDLLMDSAESSTRAAMLGAPAEQHPVARLQAVVDLLVQPC